MTIARVLPLGDASLLIDLGGGINPVTHARVRAAFAALSAAKLPGVREVIPAYTSVAVHYDPVAHGHAATSPFEEIRSLVLDVLTDMAEAPPTPSRIVEIPVHYGGAAGPDLEHVARHTKLATDEVIARHAAAEYTVYMIGFTPGFPYLGGLPAELATPRRASPRQSVPAGSVGIAGAQTGIYPLETPGGWQLIGRTDERLFLPESDPPTLLRIGDRVRFMAASRP